MDKEQLGRLGVWAATCFSPVSEVVGLARDLERWGYGTLWIPDALARDQFVEIRCQSVDPEFAAECFELVLPRVAQGSDADRQGTVFRLVGTKQRSTVAKPGDADAEFAHFRFSPG